MSSINVVYNQLVDNISNDPKKLNTIILELNKIISDAMTKAINSDESYCHKFMVPSTVVNKFYDILELDENIVKRSFLNSWEAPDRAYMYADTYYHILMLLFLYGLKNKQPILANNALTVLLFKIWNGRKYLYFKYCDKRIMKYVVNDMTTNKHVVKKYDNPFNLIKEYFVPTLIKKYGEKSITDFNSTKNLFSQCWVRINQLFVYNNRVNLNTGKKEAQGGLLPLYLKAKEKGQSISTKYVKGDEENMPSYDEYSTVHNRDTINSNIIDYITMNPDPKYPSTFITGIGNSTKVSVKTVEIILKSMHNHNYYDILHDLTGVILSRANVVDDSDICNSDFIDVIKKKIISSKNNPETKKINLLLDQLLNNIFEKNMIGVKFDNYSTVHQIQIRNIVIYGLIYNAKKRLCHGVS